ncbi:MAG: trigger factor [Thiobacillaceae bacterium]|jgi:trigger factor|nr:trigger factor [Thiobacillaceae bacterium]
MQTQVENLGGLERRITLSLNLNEIESEVGKRLQRLSKNVRMDGFRPGKAPLKVVAQRYGGEVRGEVMGEALQKGFVEATTAEKLSVAGYPRFDRGHQETGASEASFTATFEVFPQISLGDTSQIKVNRPVVEVTDADVDRTLEVLRKQRLHYHAVEREAKEGDRVHIDYTGKIAGEPFPGGEAKDFPVVLGEGRTLKAFEGQLTGMRAGEAKTFEVTFPDDYFAKELAGKTASFEAIAKSVHEPHLPEVDEAFARSLGIADGSVATLREEIAGNLRREAKRRVQVKVKEQVMQGLLDTTPFDVPNSLVAMERHALRDKAVNDLKARGMKEQDIRLGEDIFDAQARRRVALSLLLNEIARANGIRAEGEQVKAMVEEFAQSYEDPSEVVAWYYQDANRLREAESLVLEENIVNWVLEHAQVTDEPVTLEALMGKA